MKMSATSVKVRKASIDDIRVMVSLLKELYDIESGRPSEDNKQRAGLRRLIAQRDAVVLVAELEDLVVGMCTVQTIVATAEGTLAGLLDDMVVHDKFRGRGIGTALLAAAGRWAAEHRLNFLQVLAGQANEDTLRFYGSRGWRPTGLVCMQTQVDRHRLENN